MINGTIRIGSRESVLAVIQSELIIEEIKRVCPGVSAQLVTMKTTGDMILDKSLEQIGGKGLFVKELDRALLDGRCDLTVHSLKDMPMEVPERLPILALSLIHILSLKDTPYIVARGRKGGSNVAAAVCNALIYQINREQ